MRFELQIALRFLREGRAQSALIVGGNFTVGSGCTFSTATLTHSVGGNFTNDGTFTAATSTVTFNGGSAQTAGGAVSTTFNNLTLNDANGLSLTASETVNATLSLGSGKFTLGSSNL